MLHAAGEVGRRAAFFAIDLARGGCFRRDLLEYRTSWFTSAHELENRRKARLAELLKHAVLHVPFYVPLHREFSNDPHEWLLRFPVITKSALRENQAALLAENYRPQDLIKTKTSGSSGQPMVYWRDERKKTREQAGVISFGQWSGLHVGARHAVMRSGRKSAFTQKIHHQDEFVQTHARNLHSASAFGQATIHSGAWLA